MMRFPEIVIGSLALCWAVSADTVFTRDGQIHQGKISLGTNYTVRVVAPGLTNVVTATNLLRAVFGPDVTAMPWHLIGPFGASGFEEAHDKAFFNEAAVDLKKEYGNLKWKEANFIDGMVHVLSAEPNSATYLYRIIHAASPITLDASLGSNDSIKLWLNGRLILNNKVLRITVPGQDRVRLELVKGENKLLMKVTNGQVSSSFYFKTQRRGGWSASRAVPTAGIMTWDGSFIPVQVEKMDDEKVYYSNVAIVRPNVSTVFFRPLSVVEVNKMNNKPAGVLLMNGDFVEGELRSMDQNEVVVSSVLFGLKKYKPYEEAIALVLRPASKTIVRHHFKLSDNSLMFAKKFGVKGSQITLSEGPFKGRVIPLTQVVEMTYGSVPNLLQGSAIHWKSLPGNTRQSLEIRDRHNQSIIQEYSKWSARLAIAKNVTADELPPLVKAETDARAAQTKALSLRNEALQKVTAKTQAHAQAKAALTAAGSKLDADCSQIEFKSEALANLISTGQKPKLQILAQTQRKCDEVALAHVINARDLIEIQAEITQASMAQKAAESAVKASVANVTAVKAKLTASAAALTAAEKALQSKQKTAADAHATLTNALKSSLQPAFKQKAASNWESVDARQRQARAEQKIRQLNIAVQKAATNFQALDKATKAAVTAVESAKAKATTATTSVTTAKTKLTTAADAVKTAKLTLESLQKTQLNPAIAKAEAAGKSLTVAIQGKSKADQLLADVNKVLAKANKLAQAKFEPAQVKKGLVATQALAEQLKVLTAAVRAPIDDINAARKIPTLAIGVSATNSLVTAMVNKKTADQTMVTLKENIAKATSVHASAEKAAVAAEAKARIALSLVIAATNTLSMAMKDFESKQSVTATMQKTMEEKFTALKQAAQAAGTTRKVVIQANFIKSRASQAAQGAKTRLTKATANSTAAGEAGKHATATASTTKTLYTAANSTLTTAKSNVNTKKSTANNARNALATLAKKQIPATAKTAMAHKKYVRAQLAHSAAQQSLAAATNQVGIAKVELQKVEQKSKDTKDENEVAALKKQVTEAKLVLSQLTNVRQKQSASKVDTTLSALAKALRTKVTADKALTALNVQVTLATTAAHKTVTELNAAAARLNAAQVKLDQANVNQQLANVRATSTQSGIATAKQLLTEATAADKATKALATATTTAATKAGTVRITASKTLTAATQQATASTVAYRASVKVQADADIKVKMAEENIKKAAKNLEAEKKLAQQQRTLADETKQILDDLSTSQQNKATDTVTAAAAAITRAQAEVASANQALKAIETELTALVPTLLLMNQAEAAAMTLINTLSGDDITEVKLTAEKKALMVLIQKAVESYVNVHQKEAMAKATAANTALAQAKANKTAATKESTMIKLKTADAVTVLQKAEQVLRDAETGLKTAEMAMAMAQEEQAMAEKLADGKAKQTEEAKASLTQLTEEQKLAVTAAATAKTGLTKAMADQVQVTQALHAANKAIITMMLSRKTAKKAVQDSEEKMLAVRIASEKLSKELTILVLQAAACQEKATRVERDLARLKALRYSPATQKATSLNTASTQALNNRGTAEKALTAANLAVTTQELARRAAIDVELTSAAAELKAQQAEVDGWKDLILAKQEAEQAETDYMKTVAEYRARKQEADAVRGKLSKAKAETNLSNTNLARLKPAYDAIIRH